MLRSRPECNQQENQEHQSLLKRSEQEQLKSSIQNIILGSNHNNRLNGLTGSSKDHQSSQNNLKNPVLNKKEVTINSQSVHRLSNSSNNCKQQQSSNSKNLTIDTNLETKSSNLNVQPFSATNSNIPLLSKTLINGALTTKNLNRVSDYINNANVMDLRRNNSPAIKKRTEGDTGNKENKRLFTTSINLAKEINLQKKIDDMRITKSIQGSEWQRAIKKAQQENAQHEEENIIKRLDQPLKQIDKNNQQSNTSIPNHEPTKCSFKRNGIVKAYAANTNQGLIRNYNEDRVSIILNILKPASRSTEQWPKCSFFGVYDGHGGVNCADFLRDNLHQFVIKENSFPWNPKEALRNGFLAAEKHFLDLSQKQSNGLIDKSGSCCIVILIVGDMCYVANVGDSRAVLSGDCGLKIYTLSRDHKPTDELEQKRIIAAGGKIYQTQAQTIKPSTVDQKMQTQLILGPLRVFPGRLSVSRTFGDIEAKLEKFNGNPNVIICEPEIKSFKITDEHDFIIIGSDGIYDKLSSKEVIQCVWDSQSLEEVTNIHKQCGIGVENIMKSALNKRTLDNITAVMICFQNFKKMTLDSKQKLAGQDCCNENENNLQQLNQNNSNIQKQSMMQQHFNFLILQMNANSTDFLYNNQIILSSYISVYRFVNHIL